MAADKGSSEPEDDEKKLPNHRNRSNGKEPIQPNAEAEEEESEDEEPRLKYAPLTKHLTALYRNGDASSAFLVGGDKMVVGTHNGNVHVLTLPTLQSLRAYRAHTASVTAISISPWPPPLPVARSETVNKLAQQSSASHGRTLSTSSESPSKPSAKQTNVPAIPSNQIYIATASIDGNVCISSLVDARDVQLRNFGRPVQAVALSPEYKNDRTYLSGGLAGSLVLTVGGATGKTANATTTGAAAAASGWLGSMGLGSNTGTDKILHSGEGSISTIKWSLSGRYVLWVNEHGIKIMRSHLHLESSDSAFEWKRMSHIDRPNRPGWEEMASVWKARAEWIDRDNLETEDGSTLETLRSNDTNGRAEDALRNVSKKNKPEEVLVGWGGTVWILKVYHGSGRSKEVGEKAIGRVEISTILRFDCIVSGVSLYTPNLLLVLAYSEAEEQPSSANDTPTKKGRHYRQSALEPELRLIDITTKPEEEVSADTLTISRYQSLSSSDYQLGILPPFRLPPEVIQRGTFETISSGLWDATLYPTRMFSSATSIRSGRSGDEKASAAALSAVQASGTTTTQASKTKEAQEVTSTHGMKIFILSPYDVVVAVKRDYSDRLNWLTNLGRYQEAWELLNEHPEAAGPSAEPSGINSPQTSSKGEPVSPSALKGTTSLAEFFADTASSTSLQRTKNLNSIAEKEKRRVGEKWLQQVVSKKDWSTAADIASKVLGTASSWEHWVWTFIQNNKFDEITPHVPTFQITPPLPPTIYEIILGHYVSSNKARFKELLDLWPTDLFDINSVTTAIEEQFKSKDIREDSDDGRLLKECLAKLFIAEGRYEDALRCYIQLHDAETALTMIKEYHLLNTIADDIPGLMMLRLSSSQLKSASQSELEVATADQTKLLVSEAHGGTVSPEVVISQLEKAEYRPLLYFYLRALWNGEGAKNESAPRIGHSRAMAQTSLAADEGKTIVDDFADIAVNVFAEYDRSLLRDYLHASTAYNFDHAVQICEGKKYISELVYLLAKTGQTKKALFLIINDLKDVSQAISFAKEQDDQDLWDDLLDYSMSRPKFIEGLLSEVGTAIDPITLIKRIPSGLEIEGLKDGLKKMMREYDLQDSISSGAAKVLASEVSVGMTTLRKGRNHGLRFDIEERPSSQDSMATTKLEVSEDEKFKIPNDIEKDSSEQGPKPGHCAGCEKAFYQDESEPLIIFACSHAWHLSHLLNEREDSSNPVPTTNNNEDDDPRPPSSHFSRTVGAKVTNARLLRDKIAAVGGCRICRQKKRDQAVELG